MSRSAKLAGAAAFGGLLMAIAIRAATLPPAPPQAIDNASAKTTVPPPPKGAFQRCRTIIEPEPACAAAWDAERRRFFRTQDRQP